MQKTNFISIFFFEILYRHCKLAIFGTLEILQRYYKVVVLGALGMPGHAHPKWYYQFVENFCIYLQVKNQFHNPCFSGDTIKTCKLILGALGMSGYT